MMPRAVINPIQVPDKSYAQFLIIRKIEIDIALRLLRRDPATVLYGLLSSGLLSCSHLTPQFAILSVC